MNAPLPLSHALPPQTVSLDVLREKYARGDEADIAAVRARVARALAAVEPEATRADWETKFLWAQEHGFIPAGRIAAAAGSGLSATLMNCFVQPLADCLSGHDEQGRPGIYTALAESAETMRRGGGVGYDFSPIRPAGSQVRGSGAHASGPVAFLRLFDLSGKTVESAGARRGAQMGVLRIDHPDIAAFIAAKDAGDLKNFNLSVGVTDAFMRAVAADERFDLVHAAPADHCLPDKRHDGLWIYDVVRARDLWDKVIKSTYDHAEPGVLFLDTINRDNNLWYCETLAATNPCGEQPLPPYGCCDLGSLNLTTFVRAPFTSQPSFDWEQFRDVATVAVRMLDNVLDASAWPLPQQQAEAQAKRRIGLGFLGLGSALVMLGLRYDSAEGRAVAGTIARELRDAAYGASIDLAREKGPFPLFDRSQHDDGQYIQRLPLDLRRAIQQHGIRNSHLLSIAPTGTITLAFADNASNGIEPAYAWTYERKKRMPDDSTKTYQVEDHAYRLYRQLGHDTAELPSQFVTALELRAADHLAMMQAVQPYVDTAISKTVNVPADYPFTDFQDLYTQAWQAGLKGLATYRPNAVTGSVLSTTQAPAAPQQPDSDPLRTRFDHREPGDLDAVTTKIDYTTQEGRKAAYVVVSFKKIDGVVAGQPLTIERPVEFFMPAGQHGSSQQWISTTMRLLSQTARLGGSIARALADMRQVVWENGPVRCGHLTRADGAHVPLHHDSEVAAIAYQLQQLLHRRGFLDQHGHQVPAAQLAQRGANPKAIIWRDLPPDLPARGAKCPDCGAHALHKVDGCQHCEHCHFVGTCG